jgi:tRNA1(Val) A37 N6-methylase TrmN6
MAEAMHGMACTLSEVVACAKYLLRNGGKFFLVIRAKRVGELFHLLYEHNVKPKRFRAVHPKPDRPASVVLVEAVRASGDGVTAESPLFIHDSGGEYTEALLEAYRLPERD